MTSSVLHDGRLPARIKSAGKAAKRLIGRPRTGPADAGDRRPPGGWRTVAAKEFADHVTSVRFLVLLVMMGLACIAAVVSAAGFLREAATDATGAPSPFLLLFTQSPEQIPSVVTLVGFLGPLLGVAFGFDAVNQERADRTLPKLVSQPIHRDDVINGKFVAGISVIGLTLVSLVAIVAGIGIVRMGITPSPSDIARMLLYLIVALAYIGLWLGSALLCSIVLRRPATAALVAIAAWLVLTLFGSFFAGLAASVMDDNESAQVRTEHNLSQVSPATWYDAGAAALLNPQVRSTGLLTAEQLDRAVAGTLPTGQSLLVVWPQVTALIAGSVVMFSVGYFSFLRQEVRA